MKRFARACIWGGLVLVLTNCISTQQKRQLELVAKDWCLNIGASQVIPVYPLTEDIQPGDIFLVQVPIENQRNEYRGRGFLPLDNLIYRLNPRQYSKFYEKSFKVGNADKELPFFWLNPGNKEAWNLAPLSCFPTYSFSVRQGGGLNLALPVQGIPVGLSLLGTNSAQCSVQIANARTYGIDILSLCDDVHSWERDNREFLRPYASTDKNQNYIRVINRVFLTGCIRITLQAEKSESAGVSGGIPKPVELLTPAIDKKEPGSISMTEYKENFTKMSDMVNQATKTDAGVTVKLVGASARLISMDEKFARPLVFGYLAFDMMIGYEGVLGPPIPTRAFLAEEKINYPIESTFQNAELGFCFKRLSELGEAGDQSAKKLVWELNKLISLVPKKYPCHIFGFRDVNKPIEIINQVDSDVRPISDFTAVTWYQGTLIQSINDMEIALKDQNVQILDFTKRTPDAEVYLREQIEDNRKALKSIQERLNSYKTLIRSAINYSLFGKEK